MACVRRTVNCSGIWLCGGLMKPRAFLSYRHDFTPEIAAKDTLVDIVNRQSELELIFDKSVTKVDDCVIAFMEELIASRSVFIFISEDYFKSAYTLFELIAINEHKEVDDKIILPICLSEEMVNVRDCVSVKDHWDSDPATRDVLSRLLTHSGRGASNDDVIWNKISDAWDKLIFPYLNRLKDLDVRDHTTLINISVDDATDRSKTKTEQIMAGHKLLIIEEVEFLFGYQPQLKEILARNLRERPDVTPKVLAKKLIGDAAGVAGSIGVLTNASRSLRETQGSSSTDWRTSFQDIKQICGCLLLNAIDPTWWFNHELELRSQKQKSILGDSYKLDEPAFVEVVISKELLSQGNVNSPIYALSSDGKVVPSGVVDQDYDNFLMFDAVNVDAVGITLLGKIHNDLNPSVSLPDGLVKLQKGILNHALAVKNDRGKPVYYIVSQNYLEQLKKQTWFPDFESQMKGCLQFICCSKESISGSNSATEIDQDQLLTAVDRLLKLNEI